ncbi:MAG: GspMb/PilO family protein [Pyrinomonadaceae bacterium]
MKNGTPATTTTTTTAPAKHDARRRTPEALRARLSHLRAARARARLGSTELVALVASFALLALTLGAYFLYLAPARARLLEAQHERTQLQAYLREAEKGTRSDADAQATANDILKSLSNFESERLASREEASTAVIEELNAQTRRHSLARAQFSFTYQDERAQSQRPTTQGPGTSRRQTIFPGIDITLTVEGPYANIRRFIRDLEASPRFVVINGVQLEGVNESGAGGARGAVVSLRLDMSAYFRRAGAQASMEQ